MEDETGEDVMTTTYMRETAEEAGLATEFILMDQIGRASDRGFLDLEERPIRSIFKLYPWEWILKEKFGRYAIETYPNMIWIEPIWKMLLSNKAILAVLWELFPNHPNLLETYSDGPRGMREYVRKPALGREGANIFAQTSIGTVRTGGSYGSGLHVYQKFSRPRIFDGVCPIIGGWVVDNAAAGMGIRESAGIITDSHSQFVPHIIE
jgi:glutathionylspermidine synthase